MHCVIVASQPIAPALLHARTKAADCIIAADAGYRSLQAQGISPSWIVGDFDSAPLPSGETVICLPKEKDDTDTYYAARKALELGAQQVDLLGALGGRLDHTMANLQTLIFLEQHGVAARLLDETTEIRALLPGTYHLQRQAAWVSLFPLGAAAYGVTLEGMKYPLHNATLRNSFPIGVSNEFAADSAQICVQKGGVYLLLTAQE